MRLSLFRFIQDESGGAAIEYSLVAMLIAMAVITAITSVGNNLGNTWNKVANSTNN